MANNCLFDMRITGKEDAIKEFIAMLKWEGEFKEKGLGLGSVFEFDAQELEETSASGIFAVTGFGDCAWSIKSALRTEYRGDTPTLESETERLGLVVEVFSSEPGHQFQEHCLFVKGDVVIDDCVHYEKHWIEGCGSLEKYNQKNDTNFTLDMVNENGDVCIGGFGDYYGVFADVTHYFAAQMEEAERMLLEEQGSHQDVKPSLDEVISGAKASVVEPGPCDKDKCEDLHIQDNIKR